jgi:hypothetical protein
MKPTASQTPKRDALIAAAKQNPRCTVIERKPGQAIATFLSAEALEQVKRALSTQDRKKP